VKICIILEGSYPYVRGGVSNWVDGIIRAMPQHEFILWTIADSEEKRGKFQYEIPQNVLSIQENFIDEALKSRINKSRNIKFSQKDKHEISNLIRCKDPDWGLILNQFTTKYKNPIEIFTSENFLEILENFAHEDFPFVGFTDLFWTVRSMFLPLFYLLEKPIPKADIYHSASTGYAGVLGAFASIKYQAPYIVTEHGIYTREREEEILRSDWVSPAFKDLWISMFYMYAKCAYQQADRVTSLFERASLIQQESGAPPQKCQVIPNGISYDRFSTIPLKEDHDWINIGAIVRIAPIKDIKTMLYTFSRLKQEIKNVRLFIMGGIDDEEYYQECLSLIEHLDINDIQITGLVDVVSYFEKLDFTILTSISEGQPLAILESFSARRPVVATDVGCIRELIEGSDGDNLGKAGICVPPMHQTKLLMALIDMCRNKRQRVRMGKVGQERVENYYRQTQMIQNYLDLYESLYKQTQRFGLSQKVTRVI
jgi:polysaccharide biosynthesis protein PelF